MKTIRLDFTKGVNSRTDPMLFGDNGFLLVADNVDARSGIIRPVSAPEFERDLNASTARIFEFRGRWHTSTTLREWAAEYVGNHERVYYSDPGESPMKVVNGVTGTLGQARPKAAPTVEKSAKIIATSVKGTGSNGTGALEPGGYGYRIGYRTKKGYLQASDTITANVPTGENGAILLEWDAPDFSDLDHDAQPISVVVYGRDIGRERKLAELTVDCTEYLDNGGATPSGYSASSYDTTAPMRYCYTFEREIGGHIDESGPSPLSVSVDSSSGRLITFDANDGADTFVKFRNLYRIGDASIFSLVAKIDMYTGELDASGNPIPNLTYLDILPLDALGGGPDSEYDDEAGRHIIFDKAPHGLKRPTAHNGMLFGIHENTVRWTPVNRPDAWPSAYSVPLPYPPIQLSSFAGGLIILGQDALYRLDGWDPGNMTLTRMPIEDGCIAPFSVQKTSYGLIYLSARGLMRYTGGMSVEPLTEARLESRTLLAPSSLKVDWAFWWLPTKAGQAFAAQTRHHPSPDVNNIAPALNDTRVIDGPMNNIRSFVFDGKYHLYYAGDPHGAGTTWVIDLTDPERPITTMGLRPLDVHVTSMEQCFLLLPDFKPNGGAFQVFRNAQVTIDQTLAGTTAPTTARVLARWGKGRERIGWYIRSGPMSQGRPTVRKRYRYLEFYGSGSVEARVSVDGTVVAQGVVSAIETPSHARRLNLPRSCRGYAMDVELAGSAELMALSLAFDGMPSES